MGYKHKFLALALCLGALVVAGLIVLFYVKPNNEQRQIAAPPAARFYMILFSYEDALNLAGHSHLFASFVKLREPGGQNPAPEDVETHTISWLPRALKNEVDILTSKPEPGRNYTLDETLQNARKHDFKIKKWGAFEIPQWLFERAIENIAILDSGRVMYLANDTDESHRRAYLRQEGGAENCIHAVSDLVRFQNVGLNWGPTAARLVLKEDFMPLLIHPDVTNKEIPRLLGLDWISDGD